MTPTPEGPADRLRRQTACPSCGAPLAQGFLGTNGRVFWSNETHALGVFGDENLIPLALVTTNYRTAARCGPCGLVLFALEP